VQDHIARDVSKERWKTVAHPFQVFIFTTRGADRPYRHVPLLVDALRHRNRRPQEARRAAT